MFRDPKYLAWLRNKPCFGCGHQASWRDKNTASHNDPTIGVKCDDNIALPLCGECHWLFEYHKNKWIEKTGRSLPTENDCTFYFELYRKETSQKNTFGHK